MTTPFYKGQVIKARRSEVDKYQRGWYISEGTGHDLHLVHIEGGGAMEVKGDNLQVQQDMVSITCKAFVFRHKKTGAINIIAFDGEPVMEDVFADFMGRELVGIIDLANFNITFPEGEGLLPRRYKTDPAKADR